MRELHPEPEGFIENYSGDVIEYRYEEGNGFGLSVQAVRRFRIDIGQDGNEGWWWFENPHIKVWAGLPMGSMIAFSEHQRGSDCELLWGTSAWTVRWPWREESSLEVLWKSPIDASRYFRPLPLDVHWGATAVNSVFWAFVAWVSCAGFVAARRRWRDARKRTLLARGVCPNCCYEIRGLAKCPECGLAIGHNRNRAGQTCESLS